jgi:hypothetical protein
VVQPAGDETGGVSPGSDDEEEAFARRNVESVEDFLQYAGNDAGGKGRSPAQKTWANV